MKMQKTAALLAAMLIALSGCSEVTVGLSQEEVSEEEPVIGQSAEALKEQEEKEILPPDDSRIPTELDTAPAFVEEWKTWDMSQMPPQYLMQMDETALKLIETVREISLQNQMMRPFDGISHASTADLMRIALKNTPSLNFSIQVDRDDKGNVSTVSEEHPNHVLTLLMQNELEEGRDIRDFYYQEDVAAVYRRLFGGGRNLVFQDLCPKYYYYAREGVFGRKGDAEKNQVWPMMVRYEIGENTITADLLLTEENQKNKPLIYHKADGGIVELTADNYRTHLAGEPVYRYTFKKGPQNQFLLDGIRQIGILDDKCQNILDLELPVQEKGPSLKMPERMTVSSESVQSQIDLQKAYQDTTAADYLMGILSEGQLVEGEFASKVLAGSGAETLTLTLGYQEGEEKVITIISSSYLPGIEESYLTFSVDSQQYILPQKRYANIKTCLISCKS